MEKCAMEKIIELEKENKILEANRTLMGDNDGQIFYAILDNNHAIAILKEQLI